MSSIHRGDPARSRRRLVAAGVAAPLLLLTGCAGQTPGAAIVVGDEQVSSRAVAEAAEDICTLSEEQLVSASQAVPMNLMRARAVELMTLGAVAEQIAEEYDVELGADFEEQLGGFEADAASLPKSAQDTFIELSTDIAYSEAVKREVGRLSLAEEGVEEATPEDEVARGNEVFVAWQEENDVRINPRYGVGVVDGAVVAVPTDTSLAVSDVAVAGLAEEVDPEAAGDLPAAQRCG